jgi:hypothetical protein
VKVPKIEGVYKKKEKSGERKKTEVCHTESRIERATSLVGRTHKGEKKQDCSFIIIVVIVLSVGDVVVAFFFVPSSAHTHTHTQATLRSSADIHSVASCAVDIPGSVQAA